MKRMLDDLRKDKEELIKKRDELKAQYKTLQDGEQMKQVVYMKIRKIEEDLKTEYYKILGDKDEEDTPSVSKPKPPTMP
jgi:predicted nuclease with TOPRIM domain